MKNILFIHQSAELYGSDKTLLLFLKYIDRTKFNGVVIIPFDGPLKIELEKVDIKVVIAPVLKLYRQMFAPMNLFRFFKDIKAGFKVVDELNKEYKFDVIYSNTLAVLLGLFYAKKSETKHLWHVHEIIESPKIFTKLFRILLATKSNTLIVYNSNATKDFWNVKKSISSKSIVVCNGLEITNNRMYSEQIDKVRKALFNSNSTEIIIALVGRISRWKGQKVLLNSFNQILKTHSNCKLAFIGSPPPNQAVFLEELQNSINELKISEKVIHIPFTEDIAKIWQCIDIAVVPSTEPEPFGLVAVEAMLAEKPVVASNHGGLTEIILNNETGFLVEPSNEDQLTDAISKLIKNPALINSFGVNGFNRAIKEYSVEKYTKSLEKVIFDL